MASIYLGPYEVSHLESLAGCSSLEWPLQYLGVALGRNPNANSFWDPVVTKVTKRRHMEKRFLLLRWMYYSHSS